MATVIETRQPAEVYDQCFVPALFAHWGPVVAAAAGIRPGERVLDVACGTGALTLAAAALASPRGSVVGLDLNPAMLAVARGKSTDVEWREAPAEALPFADAAFDAVVSQFGMMFFADRIAALAEMWRVLRPGGRLAVAVFDTIENAPGYAALARLLDELFGRDLGDALSAPFTLGNARQLATEAEAAGIAGAEVTTHPGTVRFASVDALVSTERACIWTLGGLLDDGQFATLRRAATSALRPYVGVDGSVAFAMPALLLTAHRTG
jgi:ubiquinone/menaquinone biosynthesis C-methylase UbiE